jgi:O-antigen/teichoic acid export membrane protein
VTLTSLTAPTSAHDVVVPIQRSVADRPRVARSAAVLSIAMGVAYAGTYLLAVGASRLLSNSQYGVFAALLAVLTVVTVPGLALQAVIARRSATHTVTVDHALTLGLVVGLGCAGVAAIMLPALGSFLHIGGIGGMAAALGATLPLTVLSAVQGWLQGHERFGALAAVVLLAGGAKLIGGIVPLLLGSQADVSMIGVTALTAVVSVAAVIWCRRNVAGHLSLALPRLRGARSLIPWSELGPAAVGFGGLLLMSNLDLLLGRHLLTGSLSGRYAAATVVAKVALWIPQAIALTVLPRLAHIGSRAATLRASLLATSALGLLGCLVMVAFGSTAMRITFGPSYGSLGSTAWMFALQGSALALTQLMIIVDIAQARRGVLRMILAAAAVETVAALAIQPHSITGLVTIATISAVSLAGLAVRRTRSLADGA